MELPLDEVSSGQTDMSMSSEQQAQLSEEVLQQALQEHMNAEQENAESLLDTNKKDKGSKGKKKGKRLCLGCERPISSRLYCFACYKRRARNGGVLPTEVRRRGRPHVRITQHSNPGAKFDSLEKKIEVWIGNKEESVELLKQYAQQRVHHSEKEKVYQEIGESMCDFVSKLPKHSPFRKSLIFAMSQKSKARDLREVVPVSAKTISVSKKLPENENLILTSKSSRAVSMNSRDRISLDEDNSMASIQEQMISMQPLQTLQSIQQSMQSMQPGQSMQPLQALQSMQSMQSMQSGQSMQPLHVLQSFQSIQSLQPLQIMQSKSQ